MQYLNIKYNTNASNTIFKHQTQYFKYNINASNTIFKHQINKMKYLNINCNILCFIR